jgi:predicted ATPase
MNIEFNNLLQRLKSLSIASPKDSEIAQQWITSLSKKQEFLDKRDHPIVFIGNVGVGKSSLIGVVANLFIGPMPTDKTTLKNHSVLAIGAGRTTVCEVCIRAPKPEEGGKLGLLIEPITKEEMEKEIAIYAETEFYRRQPDKTRTVEDDAGPTPQEIQRVIRNMTDYAEYQEMVTEGDKKQRRTVRPLDKVIPNFNDPKALSEHLIERANLAGRTEAAWWWKDNSIESLKALKNLFEEVNQGKQPTTMLPHRMNVIVPDPLPGSAAKLELTLIDTRGLDGPVESRADLYEYLREPRAVIVLCASFKDAPGNSQRALLHLMSADAELRQAIPRTLVVLLDQGDAEQVNGADGDRESGQSLKIDECSTALEDAGLQRLINKSQIVAFDTLKDDRSRLQVTIDEHLSQLREEVEKERQQLEKEAQNFVKNVADKFRPELCNKVDQKLKETMARHLPSLEAPLRDPLEGLYEAIEVTRYASVVYATCRRNGEYYSLDLYAAVRAKASRATTAWLNDLMNAVKIKLNELKRDNSLALVYDHIGLRERQYHEAQLKVIGDYAKGVEEQVSNHLKHDSVWTKCVEEWGRGTGFKKRVLEHLKDWASRQQGITAHETTNAKTVIPLLAEVSRLPQAPQFKLHVRNLRALRQVDWLPEQLSVIIGANGTGKTTLLLVLKLLKVAYERGLPEAVSQVLGGSSNLKTWGTSETEPVEIGIDIGTASWNIQLVPHKSSVGYLTEERLTDQGREIFSCDGIRTLLYGGERLELRTEQLKLPGLRVLWDRGITEPALRKVVFFLQRIAVYHDPDLWAFSRQGSNTFQNSVLQSRGVNTISLLRRWYQEQPHQHRYQFVVDGLAVAFPNLFEKIDFVEAGNTLTARIYSPGQESPCHLAEEANGVLQLLFLFCAVASVEDESVVAIDEPENSLHPYALRAFLRRTGRWARQHKLTVLLATHSMVLLDELTPEQVYVMKDTPVPTRLDQLCNSDWLKTFQFKLENNQYHLGDFKLGDLYEHGEIGSNEDEV